MIQGTVLLLIFHLTGCIYIGIQYSRLEDAPSLMVMAPKQHLFLAFLRFWAKFTWFAKLLHIAGILQRRP